MMWIPSSLELEEKKEERVMLKVFSLFVEKGKAKAKGQKGAGWLAGNTPKTWLVLRHALIGCTFKSNLHRV